MNVIYDKSLDIATGTSRKTKTWKNAPVLWSELLERLSSPVRTPETVAEYKAMSTSRQSAVKDVGGFVGGYCNNGRRADVRFRSLLCLDADFANSDLWDDWCLIYGNAAAVYSTHKHTPKAPRLRLVVPLSRTVTPEEYEAIGRRVAEQLGIDQFDDTSYQPQRLMYWPSCSHDGEYVFEHLDADFLDADAVLATYVDWHDVSSWPLSSRQADVTRPNGKTQEDPTAKGGLIGAFCRAHSITDAIEHWVPTYQPCDEPNRYTYTEGSTAAGVVIYNDKWSYSHHATDPASGVLCNAWDLVRLHQYGELDADVDPDTPVSSRPSYKAMAGLASGDPETVVQMTTERVAEASADFGSEPQDGENWMALLKYTEKGALVQSIENGVTILSHDPLFADRLALNEMEHNIMALGALPWNDEDSPRQWSDGDDAGLRYYLEKVYGLTGKDRIYDAVNCVAMEHAYHPIKDYLESCDWDGVERLDTLLIDYLGAEDTPYTRAVTRKTFTAAVARIYEPGCKFDTMLTIQGGQGIGKSTLVAKMGGKWYSDSFTTLKGKDAYEQVLGVWIMEVGELEGLRKAEATTIKLYISKQSDRFRPAYGRRIQDFPRQCIFIGTTNETNFLRDSTGNRRFWIVPTPGCPTKSVFEDLDPATIRQLWGEAMARYHTHEPLKLSPELEEAARLMQEEYEEENPRAGIIAGYLDRPLPHDWDEMDLYSRRQWLESSEQGTEPRRFVCALEVWAEALNGNPEKVDRYDVKEIHDILQKMPGWHKVKERHKTFRLYGRQKYYSREEEDEKI